MELKEKILFTKNRIIDGSFLAIVLFGLPSLVFSYIRGGGQQFVLQNVINSILLVVILVVIFLRKRISFEVRISILLVLIELNGINNMLNSGIANAAFIVFLAECALVGLFFDSKRFIVNFIANIGIILIIMYLKISGIVPSTEMTTEYFLSPIQWVTKILTYLLYGAIVGFAVSIMTQKLNRSLMEIDEQERKYQVLIENLSTLIFSIDADGKILSLNNAFSILGIKEFSSYIGQPYDIIFTEEDNKAIFKEHFLKIVSNHEKEEFLLSYVEDNKNMSYIITLSPITNLKGELEMILGSANDISELIETKNRLQTVLAHENERLEALVDEKTEELQKTYKQLVEKEKLASLGSLVAGVAHEINTPLGVAYSAVSYLNEINSKTYKALLERNFTERDLIDYMKKVDESTDLIFMNLGRAGNLVSDFKKISVDQSNEVKIDFNVYKYIESNISMLKHNYKNTKYSIKVDCDEMLRIKNYPGAFSQIITNLLMNSLVHGFEGHKEGQVLIKVEEIVDHIVIHYSDDGNGMKEDVLSHIFEPFFTTKRQSGGSGLGLNIVYNLVTTQMNGKIEVTSTEGEGTMFTITLPTRI